MREYYQTPALPLPALTSIDDLNSSLPLEITLKHLFSARMIAVLMREAVRCMTVYQLHADPFLPLYILATTGIIQ
jgi:hypothetical protein